MTKTVANRVAAEMGRLLMTPSLCLNGTGFFVFCTFGGMWLGTRFGTPRIARRRCHCLQVMALLAAAEAFPAGAAIAQTRNENVTICAGNDPDPSIASCTALIQSAQETNANRAGFFFNRGNSYHTKGDNDRAIQDYTQAIALNPAFAPAFDNRGNAYQAKDDNDHAIADYSQAIKLNPNNANPYLNRGTSYYAKGNYDRAIKDFDQAIKLVPDDSIFFYLRGNAYAEKKGNNARAIQDYDEAIKLSPKFSYPIYNRGVLKKQMGDIAGGDADIARAREIDPDVGK